MKTKMMYLNFFLLCEISFLVFSQSCSGTTRQILTSKSATASKGYSILNSGESILLYKYMHKAHSAKEVDKYAPKYYFTTESSEVLKDLTKENLKKAYPTNHAFHDALDANFQKDLELINYDEFHKIYKVNRLLQNSKQ